MDVNFNDFSEQLDDDMLEFRSVFNDMNTIKQFFS